MTRAGCLNDRRSVAVEEDGEVAGFLSLRRSGREIQLPQFLTPNHYFKLISTIGR